MQAVSPFNHELESPTQHKKLKVKIPKNTPEENSLSALKSPRTYSKKTPNSLLQTPTESLTDDVSSSKRPALKKLSSVSSTSSVEVVPSTPSTPTSIVPSSALSPVPTSTTPVISSPTSTSLPGSGSSKKYPKRENRKPPAHLADAFSADLLFSTPDIIKRVVKTPSGQLLSSPGEVPSTSDTGMTAESLAGTVSEEAQQPQPPSATKMDILGNNH